MWPRPKQTVSTSSHHEKHILILGHVSRPKKVLSHSITITQFIMLGVHLETKRQRQRQRQRQRDRDKETETETETERQTSRLR